jgi:hypothetical protein
MDPHPPNGNTMPHRHLLPLCASLLTLLLLSAPAAANTVGYWRMETDLDPSVDGLETPNEVLYRNPNATSLISSEAFIDDISNPNHTVPNTGNSNSGSLGATYAGGGNGINATAAWYADLDVSSITLEFWARTGEGQATIISRSFASDGIIIDNPNALEISYFVETRGRVRAYTLETLYDMDTVWRHYAFTYDETDGVANFYVDDVLEASLNGRNNAPLHWGTDVDLEVGTLMDFAGAFNGTMDELKIHDRVITPGQFLSSPEPGTGVLVLIGLAGLAAERRHSRPRRATTGPDRNE